MAGLVGADVLIGGIFPALLEYPAVVAITPLSFRKAASTPQKQPAAKVAFFMGYVLIRNGLFNVMSVHLYHTQHILC